MLPAICDALPLTQASWRGGWGTFSWPGLGTYLSLAPLLSGSHQFLKVVPASVFASSLLLPSDFWWPPWSVCIRYPWILYSVILSGASCVCKLPVNRYQTSYFCVFQIIFQTSKNIAVLDVSLYLLGPPNNQSQWPTTRNISCAFMSQAGHGSAMALIHMSFHFRATVERVMEGRSWPSQMVHLHSKCLIACGIQQIHSYSMGQNKLQSRVQCKPNKGVRKKALPWVNTKSHMAMVLGRRSNSWERDKVTPNPADSLYLRWREMTCSPWAWIHVLPNNELPLKPV